MVCAVATDGAEEVGSNGAAVSGSDDEEAGVGGQLAQHGAGISLDDSDIRRVKPEIFRVDRRGPLGGSLHLGDWWGRRKAEWGAGDRHRRDRPGVHGADGPERIGMGHGPLGSGDRCGRAVNADHHPLTFGVAWFRVAAVRAEGLLARGARHVVLLCAGLSGPYERTPGRGQGPRSRFSSGAADVTFVACSLRASASSIR